MCWLIPRAPRADLRPFFGAGERLTDAIVEDLSRANLPRAQLESHVGEAGDALQRPSGAVALNYHDARTAIGGYALSSSARAGLNDKPGRAALAELVDDLADATDRRAATTCFLEGGLADASAEVRSARCARTTPGIGRPTGPLQSANRRAFERSCGASAPRLDSGRTLEPRLSRHRPLQDINTPGPPDRDQVSSFVAGFISQPSAAAPVRRPRLRRVAVGSSPARRRPVEHGSSAMTAVDLPALRLKARHH